jgi:hypothetical protein
MGKRARRGGVNVSCPEVICPCGFGLSPGPQLSTGVGLGTLSFIAVRYLGSEGQVFQKFEKYHFFRLVG